MADPKQQDVPRPVASIWPGVLLLAIAIGMFVWARTYSETAARFPSIVAAVMTVLAAIDLFSRTRLPGTAAIETFWGTGFRRREMMHNPSLRDQLVLVLWVLVCFAGMALLGLLAAAPLYCALYVWWRGRRTVLTALGIGLGVFVFQFAVFEWLLDYQLYRGLFLTKGGVAAW